MDFVDYDSDKTSISVSSTHRYYHPGLVQRQVNVLVSNRDSVTLSHVLT